MCVCGGGGGQCQTPRTGPGHIGFVELDQDHFHGLVLKTILLGLYSYFIPKDMVGFPTEQLRLASSNQPQGVLNNHDRHQHKISIS